MEDQSIKEAAAADIIRAREEGRLGELLPSGANIPFKFSTGEENSFDVGRDGVRTYLILHNCMEERHAMNPVSISTNEGGWPACGMRRHVQELFAQLTEEFRELAVPATIWQKVYGEDFVCEDMAFLLSSSQVFGDELLDLIREGDCHDGQIDIFRSHANRVKRRPGASGASWWWLRSADDFYSNYFGIVHRGGSAVSCDASWEGGVVFAFCIDSNQGSGRHLPADKRAEKYLVQRRDADGAMWLSLETAPGIVRIADMADCSGDLAVGIWEMAGPGELAKLILHGPWHDPKDPLYIKATRPDGSIAFDGYGTDH